jgi:hypothetical protein
MKNVTVSGKEIQNKHSKPPEIANSEQSEAQLQLGKCPSGLRPRNESEYGIVNKGHQSQG